MDAKRQDKGRVVGSLREMRDTMIKCESVLIEVYESARKNHWNRRKILSKWTVNTDCIAMVTPSMECMSCYWEWHSRKSVEPSYPFSVPCFLGAIKRQRSQRSLPRCNLTSVLSHHQVAVCMF